MERKLLLLSVFILFFTGLLQAQIFTEDFADKDVVLNTWDIIDANDDDKTWYWAEASSASGEKIPCMRYAYHLKNAADDYLVLKEPINLLSGEYSFKLSYQCTDQESFEVLYGISPDVTAMISIGDVNDRGRNWTDTVFRFKIEEENNYYFAIHATSPAYQFYLDITDIVIDEFIVIIPDLSARNIYMPVGGCDLTDNETVRLQVANYGRGAAESFTVIYDINDGEEKVQTFDVIVPSANGMVIVELTGLDFSAPGSYTVNALIICDGEEKTDNNFISGKVNHVEPVTVPYQVSSLKAYQEALWYPGEFMGWDYDEMRDEWFAADPGVPLYTNCIFLEEGAYRISFDYQAGLEFQGLNILQDFEAYIGQSGTDITNWEKIADYKNHYTDEQYRIHEKVVNITTSGSYRIAFVNLNDVNDFFFLGLKEVRVSEPLEHDISLTAFTSATLTEIIPITQMNGDHIFVSEIRNRGLLQESVKYEILLEDDIISTETIILDPEEIKEVITTITIDSDAEKGDELVFIAKVTIENDQTPDDNELSFSTNVEDYFARDTWREESDYYFSNGIQYGLYVGAGPEFTLVNKDKLYSYTVAFSSNTDGPRDPVGISVYKKGEYFTDGTFIYYQTGEPIVFEMVQRVEEGFTTLEFSEPVELEPGTYFFIIEQVTVNALGLCYDNAITGEHYAAAYQEPAGYYVQYKKTHEGNVIVRPNFYEKDPVGIEQTANDAVIRINSNNGNIFITSNEIINSVAVSDAYGNIQYRSNNGLSSSDLEINQDGLPAGVYIAQIQTLKGTQHIKFVIK